MSGFLGKRLKQMDVETLVKAVEELEQHGLCLAVGWCDVPSSELALFLTDNIQWRAKAEGVTRQDILDFDRDGPWPRCGAKTRRGTRCKNTPSSYDGSGTLRSFADSNGDYCWAHGGEIKGRS